MNVLSHEQQVAVIEGLLKGQGIREVARRLGVHRDTVMRLACSVGEGALRLLQIHACTDMAYEREHYPLYLAMHLLWRLAGPGPTAEPTPAMHMRWTAHPWTVEELTSRALGTRKDDREAR